MDIIYKKGFCKRAELFDVFVSKFVEGGWEILEDASDHKDYRVVLHSKGSLGNTPMYLALYFYAGSNGFGNASYNIKTTRYSNAIFDFYKEWDFENKKHKSSAISGYGRLNFINSKPSSSYSGSITTGTELPVEYYYYCDLDRMIFVTIPDSDKFKQDNSQVIISPVVNFLGIPEETYLKEKNDPYYSCVINASSSSGYYEDSYKYLILNKPAALLDVPLGYQMSFSQFAGWSSPSDGGSGSGPMMLTDFYLDDPQTGLRGKLGFIYSFISNGRITKDDTIEVESENGIQVYKPLWTSSNYWSSDSNSKYTNSFAGNSSALAIRIG